MAFPMAPVTLSTAFFHWTLIYYTLPSGQALGYVLEQHHECDKDPCLLGVYLLVGGDRNKQKRNKCVNGLVC